MKPSARLRLPRLALPILIGLFAAAPTQAAVNDIFPGDYFPLVPGTSSVSLYAFDRDQTGPYANAAKLADGELASRIITLRLARAEQIGGHTVSGVLVLPWARSEASPAPLADFLGAPSEGLADLRLGAAIWLINDRLTANYLALNAFVIAPTGEYRAEKLLNAGENRWKLVLGGGWQKDITPKLLVELSPELAFYGDNDEYLGQGTLRQKPSYALTGYLRYRATSSWHLFLGGQLNAGGETEVDDLDRDDPAGNRRVMAGMTWFLPRGQQLILRGARESSIDNGFRTERELALRYQISF